MPRATRASRGGRGGSSSRGSRGKISNSSSRKNRKSTKSSGSKDKNPKPNEAHLDVDVTQDDELDIEKDVKKFFIGIASFEKHLQAQSQARLRYASSILLLYKTGVELSTNAKVRALAAAWARKDRELAGALLGLRDIFGLVEVLKALTILDSSRQIKQLKKKLERITAQCEKNKTKLREITKAKFKVKIDNLEAIRPSKGSVSGALCRQVRKWVATFSKEELEFFALQLPVENWQKLADIVHFHPADFHHLPWFLDFCFGKPAPSDSLISATKNLNQDNFNSLLAENPIPYTCLRKDFQGRLDSQAKAAVVRSEDSVDRGIWWYEELACPEVEAVINERLTNQEPVNLNYGKLMERLVTFRKMNPVPIFYDKLIQQAEAKLEKTKLILEEPIVVMADASSSMEVAIETATIVASLLAATAKSELIFFNDEAWRPKAAPRRIQDVVSLALETKACRCTAPAAALMPYYKSKQPIRTIIMVTDEEENTACEGHMFEPLYKKYRDEVTAASLIFISFLRSQTCEGEMVPKLRGCNAPVRQFLFSQNRPDLTKLDNIFGQLSCQTDDFEANLRQMQAEMENDGLVGVFNRVYSTSTSKKDAVI